MSLELHLSEILSLTIQKLKEGKIKEPKMSTSKKEMVNWIEISNHHSRA